MSRPLKTTLAVLPAAIVVLLLGITLGGHPQSLPGFVRNTLVGRQTRRFSDATDVIGDVYYRKLGQGALTDAAVKGMVASLHDRFSNYFTPSEFKRFESVQRSEFSGIGVLVAPNPLGLRILRVYDDSPAAKGGVEAGDVITSVGGTTLKGLSEAAASAKVTGRPGTDVSFAVRRGTRTKSFRLTRATVSAGFTETKLETHDGVKVGVVALSQFGPGAHADVRSSFERLQRQGAKRFVLDLRQNGGGLVTEAQLVASTFLKGGTIVTTKGRAVKTSTLHAVGTPLLPNQPLVVLVDRDTASASEIVTGALQDRHRAEVVGTRTFGKGVFQEVIKLHDGGALDITAGQYFLPSGRNLGGRGVATGAGITPDVAAQDDPKTRADEGLDKAVAVVAAEKSPA